MQRGRLKSLLSFEDVAGELGCDVQTVRSLVIEERSLPGVYVTLVGQQEPFERQCVMVDDFGFASNPDNARHIGFIRVATAEFDTFVAERAPALIHTELIQPTAGARIGGAGAAKVPGGVSSAPRISWMVGLHAELPKIMKERGNRQVMTVIRWLKVHGANYNILPDGKQDELVWKDELGSRHTVTKKRVSSAISEAVATLMRAGTLPA